jgi:hypothetical protein
VVFSTADLVNYELVTALLFDPGGSIKYTWHRGWRAGRIPPIRRQVDNLTPGGSAGRPARRAGSNIQCTPID